MWLFALAIIAVVIVIIFVRAKNSNKCSGDSIDWELYDKLISQSILWIDGKALMPFDVIGIGVWTGNPNELVVSVNTIESSTSLWKGYPDPSNRPFDTLAQQCEENMSVMESMFNKHRIEGTWISLPFGTYTGLSKKSVEAELKEHNSQHFPGREIRINIR